MKIRPRIILPAAMLLAVPAAWGIHLGDSRDAVLAEFGRPETQSTRADALETLTYPNGEIRLRDGLVCYILLTSPGDAAVPVAERDIALQMRIAELETRLAAAQARLAKAESATRSANPIATRATWTIETTVAPTYSPAPSNWRRSKTEPVPATSSGSGRGL